MSVLVGFIPTPVGYAALDAAIVEAKRRATSVIAVNVLRSDSPADDPRRAQEKDWVFVDEKMRAAGVRCENRTIEAEDVTSALVEMAGEKYIDLLVIGLRRERPIGRHLLGGSTQNIILSAPCDVLTV